MAYCSQTGDGEYDLSSDDTEELHFAKRGGGLVKPDFISEFLIKESGAQSVVCLDFRDEDCARLSWGWRILHTTSLRGVRFSAFLTALGNAS